MTSNQFTERLIIFSRRGILQHRGFTLIELLVAVAIVTGLALGTTIYLEEHSTSRLVDLTIKEMESVLIDVKHRAIAGEGGTAWGVYFENLGSSTHRYAIFSGASYATGVVQRTMYLRDKLQFGNPANNAVIEVVFAPVGGEVQEEVTITVIPRSHAPYVGTITISTLGRVSRALFPDMIAYWKFDENTGTSTRDITGFDTEAVSVFSNIIWRGPSSCKAGACIEFDGTYFLNISVYDPRQLASFSVVTWVLLTQNGTFPGILTGLEGNAEWFDARFTSLREPEFRTQLSPIKDLTATTSLELYSWHHLVYVFDGVNKKIYLDGQEAAATTIPEYKFVLDNYEIGRSSEKMSQALYGYLDELKVYSRALGADEVLKAYQGLQ